mmetsp:Transcript_6181/g.6818  ORF Transcript_6181/g.6818 Transcript_6181/m.6818 type:complete len:209 (-) Transcript_6181:933-1559(-)
MGMNTQICNFFFCLLLRMHPTLQLIHHTGHFLTHFQLRRNVSPLRNFLSAQGCFHDSEKLALETIRLATLLILKHCLPLLWSVRWNRKRGRAVCAWRSLSENVVKGCRPCCAICEFVVDAKHAPDGGISRAVLVVRVGIFRFSNDQSSGDPRGRDDHRHSHAQTCKVEVILDAIDAIRVGDVGGWRRDMIVETAVLVVRNDEHRFVPE